MKNLFITGLFVLAGALPLAASEKQICMDAAELEASLVDMYDETLATMEGPQTFVWASGIGGTWTIVEYSSQKHPETACVIAQGTDWQPGTDNDILLAASDLSAGKFY